jgi:hypothetical protein
MRLSGVFLPAITAFAQSAEERDKSLCRGEGDVAGADVDAEGDTADDFHRGDRFSHCGTDSVSLAKTDAGWKIAGFSYTVVTEGCATS